MDPTRRILLQSLIRASTAGALPGSLSASGPRPFCMYSAERGWSDEQPAREYITRRASPNDASGIPQVIAQIKKALRFDATFDILIAEQENNAFATVAAGRKILVVDVDFLEKLNQLTKTRWAAIQVIAHEIGHHIAGFMDDRHVGELNADYWSGQSLQRLGSSLSSATQAILTVGTEYDTSSHPNKYRRREAIARGWRHAAAGRVDHSYCLDCAR